MSPYQQWRDNCQYYYVYYEDTFKEKHANIADILVFEQHSMIVFFKAILVDCQVLYDTEPLNVQAGLKVAYEVTRLESIMLIEFIMLFT